MSREIEDTYRSNHRLVSIDTELEPMQRYTPRERQTHKTSDDIGRSSKGMMFFKQCLAVAIIILACVMINKSGFEFGKNCLSALGRAVRWEFDFGAALSSLNEWWNGIVGFWSDVF